MIRRALLLALLSAVGPGAAHAQDLPTLYYPFNENGGIWAFDHSGNGLDAPVETTPDYTAPTWGPGFFGHAMVFDGVGDVLNAGDDPLLDLDHYTLMAWVRYTETGQTRQEVLEKADAYWMNIRQGTQKLRAGGFYGSCESSGWFFLDSTPAIPQDTWVHVASTYDGATLQIYVDGTDAGSAPVSGTLCSNANPLAIGAKHFPARGITTAFFNGSIDDVRIFDFALSQAEVQAQMAKPVPALSWSAQALLLLGLLVSVAWLGRRRPTARPDAGTA